MIELKDTVDLMLSDDCKKKLVAEYAQACIRLCEVEVNINGLALDNDLNIERFRLFDYKDILFKRIEQLMGGDAASEIDNWIYCEIPLTIFDEDEVKLVKIKQLSGEPKMIEVGGTYIVNQFAGGFGHLFELLPSDTKERAALVWNRNADTLNYFFDKCMSEHDKKPIDKDGEKEKPIKIKGNNTEVEFNEYDEGTIWLSQCGDGWELSSPLYNNPEEAVKEWNEMVRRMNGGNE